MAELKGPLGSMQAQKQLGKTNIFKRRKGKNLVSQYSRPDKKAVYSPSASQLDMRQLYNFIVARWQTMSAGEKAVYENDEQTKKLNISGWNYFLKLCMANPQEYLKLDYYVSFNQFTGGQIIPAVGTSAPFIPYPSYPDNCPTLENSPNKKLGKEIVSDGIDDYIATEGTRLVEYYHQDFTVQMIITPKKVVEADGRIFEKEDLIYIYFLATGNLLFTKTSSMVEGVKNDYQLNQRYLCSFVFSYTEGKIKILVNGILDKEENTMDEAEPTLNVTMIMLGDNLGFIPSKIAVDELAIFSRSLSIEEIQKHLRAYKIF